MNEPCYYRVSIKGLVIDETGRFLLTKEATGEWELLGGGLDHGEDPAEGLRREVREEAGLEVTWISTAPKYFLTVKRRSSDAYIANVIYEIKLKDLNFTPSDECQELKFFTTQEARCVKLLPNIQRFVELYDPKLHM